MSRSIVLLALVMLLVSGCALFGGSEDAPQVDGTVPSPSPIATPTLQSTAVATPAPVATGDVVLNVWLVNDVSHRAEVPGGPLLADQLQSFAASRPELELDVELKSPTGQGSTTSYLRAGRSVAPSVLPDLIALPAEQLPQAAAEQLIFPLDDLLGDEMVGDLFPSATELGRYNGQLFGYPIALSGLHHLAYSSEAITQTLPSSWDALVEEEDARMVLPGAGSAGAEFVLQFYRALGGSLASGNDQPVLQLELLADALSQINMGRAAGLISLQSANVATISEAWQVYLNRGANIAMTEATGFLQLREQSASSEFAPLPGPEGPLAPLVGGWVWAISTPNPSRQLVAAELLSWLASTANMGDWTLARGLMPSRSSAFERWPLSDPYVRFLQGELARAEPYPTSAANVVNALSTAVFDVLSTAKLPRAAAEEAVAAVQG